MSNPVIGIITALPKEFAAVRQMFEHSDDHNVPGAGAGRRYVIGSIPSNHGGAHSIALCLADMGNNIAATRATLLLEHFPTVESVIMTGIAGGAPNHSVPALHVRLGDIVVSNWKGVIQYDMKELNEVTCSPRPPSSRLLEAVQLMEVNALS
jgi:nucleoside phosphorylase